MLVGFCRAGAWPHARHGALARAGLTQFEVLLFWLTHDRAGVSNMSWISEKSAVLHTSRGLPVDH